MARKAPQLAKLTQPCLHMAVSRGLVSAAGVARTRFREVKCGAGKAAVGSDLVFATGPRAAVGCCVTLVTQT
jgi:hypothetical protein